MGNQGCAQLAAALGDKVSFPGDPSYNASQTTYWSIQEARLQPACVVSPESSADVAEFIAIVTEITNCDFAIRTQGHAPQAGAANIAKGITLDLTSLSGTNISDDHARASVGAGSAWVDVYRTLNPYNKTVNGGRNGGVGVGGVTLGGGISHYSPQVGWTCDTVVNFEVVLADGSITNANGTSNPDLFRALKGGGNNFGVVTRVDFRTVDITDLRGGYLFQSGAYAPEVLTAFGNIAAADKFDVHASLVTSCNYNSTSKDWTIINIPIYTLPELHPPVYQELFSIPNITAESRVMIENITTLADEPPYPQEFQTFLTSTYAASPELLVDLFGAANESVTKMQIPSDVTWSIAFEPLPTVFTRHGQGKNVLGISEADGNAVILLAGASWTEASSSDIAVGMGPIVLKAMDDVAAKAGGLLKFKYLNYAAPHQDVFGSYGHENLEFLRETSRKYDPKGIFQKRVPGGFKLWKTKKEARCFSRTDYEDVSPRVRESLNQF